MIIVGVDPGITTGVGMLDTEDGGYDWAEIKTEVGTDRYAKRQYGDLAESAFKVASLILEVEPDVVAIEKFVLRPQTRGYAKAESVSPLVLSGMLTTWLLDIIEFQGDIAWQQAAEAKGVFTNERMKALGYWVVGKPHATDALRHALLVGRKVS